MSTKAKRETVNLSDYPDLVVIYLGMRVNAFAGIKTLAGFGPKISSAVEARPDGLLRHESVVYSLRHVGMRQYWRDFDSLEKWARSEPHLKWWQTFLRNTGGTGFWHETYFRGGGFEAVYIDMKVPTGLSAFAPVEAARGAMFSARKRAGISGQSVLQPGIGESDIYA